MPFVTFIDMSGVVGRNPADTQQRQHCLPIDQTLAYGPYPPGYNPATYPLQGSGTGVPPSIQLDPGNGGSFNPPSCILGQIYYDGAGGGASGGIGLTNTVAVDTVGTFPCPDPSNPHVFSGVSGSRLTPMPSLGLLGIGTTHRRCLHHPLPSRSHPRPKLGDILQPNLPHRRLCRCHIPGRFGRHGLGPQLRLPAAEEREFSRQHQHRVHRYHRPQADRHQLPEASPADLWLSTAS